MGKLDAAAACPLLPSERALLGCFMQPLDEMDVEPPIGQSANPMIGQKHPHESSDPRRMKPQTGLETTRQPESFDYPDLRQPLRPKKRSRKSCSSTRDREAFWSHSEPLVGVRPADHLLCPVSQRPMPRLNQLRRVRKAMCFYIFYS